MTSEEIKIERPDESDSPTDLEVSKRELTFVPQEPSTNSLVPRTYAADELFVV